MSLHIAGMEWVTPLGSGLDPVWQRLLRGEEAVPQIMAGPFGQRNYSAFRVPDDALSSLPAHPRLRRASAISRFAVAAGLAAIADARLKIDSQIAERIALVFAVANGGVTYTKRFYHDIVETGANSASPLLFPETVFNAPASHLAAILGLTGASYTLVGDGAVGVLAIQMADDLLRNDAFDYCLVVGAEEADWVLCDAYRKWRLLRSEPPIEPFLGSARGTVLSEGAGAILLGREGSIAIDQIQPGSNFFVRQAATKCATNVLSVLAKLDTDVIISSANGTFVDAAERAAILQTAPQAMVYSPKAALGESAGASGIWQVVTGALALRTQQLPPLLHSASESGLKFPVVSPVKIRSKGAIILDCGLNQQIAGLRLTVKN
jgi:3-oxoacyl-[acyl-carrier-protein] synthase II